MRRQVTGLLAALCALTLASPAFSLDARVRGELEKLAPEERLEQRCDMEAMDRIGGAKEGFRPDKVIAYAFGDPKLEGTTFNLPVRAGEGGRLFGAVTVSDIASAIAEAGAQVDKRKIIVGNPIKSLGAHQVRVKVHDDVDATVNLNVVPA